MSWFTRRTREREVNDFADAIRDELRALPVPAPSAELRERILSDRSAGARAILPDVSAKRSRRVWRWTAAGALAAAMLLVVFGRDTERTLRGSRPGGNERRNGAAELFASSGLFGGIAHAQIVSPSEEPRPALPRLRVDNADRLRPLHLEYMRRRADSAGNITESHGSLTLLADRFEGIPAWKVISDDVGNRGGGGRESARVETVYVARSDLRLLARQVHESPYSRYSRINISQRFLGDSVLGRMTTEGGDSRGVGRPIARRLPSAFGPYIADAFAPVLMRGVPLDSAWMGSASLVGWAVIPSDVYVPFELRVVGSEMVTVPAGRFDCWKIEIRLQGMHVWYWARKSDGVGVRTLNTEGPTRHGGGSHEVLLVKG